MSKILHFALAFALLLPAVASARKWVDASGLHTVEAEFVKLDERTVHLKTPDGRKIKIALRGLSKADQRYVDSVVNTPKPQAPEVEPSPGVQPASDQQITRALAGLHQESRRGASGLTALLILRHR